MKSKLCQLDRNIELIVGDSGDHDLTKSDWLPGGILTTIWGPIISLYDKASTTEDKLGKWLIIKVTNGILTITIINIYRLPQSAKGRVCNTITQYNRIEGRVKSTQKYRNETFD